MKKRIIPILVLVCIGSMMTSCRRSSTQVWEDTKTAGRYVNKGLNSFFGRHVDRGQDHTLAFKDEEAPEFLALSDDARYDDSSFANYPISKESPGDPGSSIPGIEGFSTPSGKLAHIFEKIHFGLDKYTVTGEENIRYLQAAADYLISHPHTYVFIEGHTDERGAASYNLSLGSKRSNSVREFLIDHGVSPDQLFSISYGKERPLSLDHDELAWTENRRAEFKIYER